MLCLTEINVRDWLVEGGRNWEDYPGFAQAFEDRDWIAYIDYCWVIAGTDSARKHGY